MGVYVHLLKPPFLKAQSAHFGGEKKMGAVCVYRYMLPSAHTLRQPPKQQGPVTSPDIQMA